MWLAKNGPSERFSLQRFLSHALSHSLPLTQRRLHLRCRYCRRSIFSFTALRTENSATCFLPCPSEREISLVPSCTAPSLCPQSGPTPCGHDHIALSHRNHGSWSHSRREINHYWRAHRTHLSPPLPSPCLALLATHGPESTHTNSLRGVNGV